MGRLTEYMGYLNTIPVKLNGVRESFRYIRVTPKMMDERKRLKLYRETPEYKAFYNKPMIPTVKRNSEGENPYF